MENLSSNKLSVDNFFSIQNPTCLYCKESVILHHNSYGDDTLEYTCHDCNESFYTITQVFGFSILQLEVGLDCYRQIMYIREDPNSGYSSALPIPKLDFTNKYKLVKKLKTYLTFS